MTVCKHFGSCGGCSLQNLSPPDYRAHKRDMVVSALARAGLSGVTVTDPLTVHENSRRRAVFKLARRKDKVEVGFHTAKSHSIIDMEECLVLTPALFALVGILRKALPSILNDTENAELHVTESDTGLDLAFRAARKLTPELASALARSLGGKNVARIIFNNELVLENTVPLVNLAGAQVALPPVAFLQASREGEGALQDHVRALLKGAKHIADLFAGLGTFTFALAPKARVHAVEQDEAALAALARAVRATSGLKPITTERRDLFKQPLAGTELKGFDAVLLDPPRAGAETQIQALAGSKIAKIAYVSCDPASFARDAAILVGAGFALGPVTPIDQFLYSGHIELVAGFERNARAK